MTLTFLYTDGSFHQVASIKDLDDHPPLHFELHMEALQGLPQTMIRLYSNALDATGLSDTPTVGWNVNGPIWVPTGWKTIDRVELKMQNSPWGTGRVDARVFPY